MTSIFALPAGNALTKKFSFPDANAQRATSLSEENEKIVADMEDGQHPVLEHMDQVVGKLRQVHSISLQLVSFQDILMACPGGRWLAPSGPDIWLHMRRTSTPK